MSRDERTEGRGERSPAGTARGGWSRPAGSPFEQRRFARQAGLLSRGERPCSGYHPSCWAGRVCCAGALWRGLLAAGATLYRPSARHPGIAVGCPNPVLAHALVAPARALGATARVIVGPAREYTVLSSTADVDVVLRAAAGPAAAAVWRDTVSPGRDPDTWGGGDLPAGFQAGNTARRRAAAAASSAEIAALLDRYGADTFPEHLRAAGLLRLAHPQLSLTELVADPPMTKDALGGRLRRLRTTNTLKWTNQQPEPTPRRTNNADHRHHPDQTTRMISDPWEKPVQRSR